MGVRLSLSFRSNHFSLRGTTCSLGQRNIHFVTKWACQSLTSRIRPGGLFLEYFCSFFLQFHTSYGVFGTNFVHRIKY